MTTRAEDAIEEARHGFPLPAQLSSESRLTANGSEELLAFDILGQQPEFLSSRRISAGGQREKRGHASVTLEAISAIADDANVVGHVSTRGIEAIQRRRAVSPAITDADLDPKCWTSGRQLQVVARKSEFDASLSASGARALQKRPQWIAPAAFTQVSAHVSRPAFGAATPLRVARMLLAVSRSRCAIHQPTSLRRSSRRIGWYKSHYVGVLKLFQPPGEIRLTGAQVRAARALLDLTAAEVARECKLGVNTVLRVEARDGPNTLTAANAEALLNGLVRLGVSFISADAQAGPGVRLSAPNDSPERQT